MRNIPRTGAERRVDSYGFRRERSVDREPKRFRYAGELFGVEKKDKERQVAQEVRRRLQSVRPVGLNFGEKDNYGPDESWDTQDPIIDRPSPGYYKDHRRT